MGARRVLGGHDHEPPFTRRPRSRRPDREPRAARRSPPSRSGSRCATPSRAGPVKDALSGTWLGHALHPLLTDLPIGTWTSAVLLDWLGGDAVARPAADRLIALGIAFTAPAVATGWTEWADSEVGRRRACAASASSTRPPTSARPRCSARRSPPAAAARAGRASCSRWRARACSARAATSAATWRSPRASASTRRRSRRRRRTGRRRCATSELPEGESRYAEVAGVGVLRRAPRRRGLRALEPLLAPRRPARRGRARRRLRHLPAARLDVPAGRRRRGARPGRLPAAGLAGPRARRRDRAQGAGGT